MIRSSESSPEHPVHHVTTQEAREVKVRVQEGLNQMENALHSLRDPGDGTTAGVIHATRKLGKSLRGALTLFGLRNSAAREIQAVGRLLSEFRNAESRRLTWLALDWRADRDAAQAIESLLEQCARDVAFRLPADTLDWACERVGAAAAEFSTLRDDKLPDILSKGWSKLENKVERRVLNLREHKEECFHEARKALKAMEGAASFAGFTVPDWAVRMMDLLGDENDLSTLHSWLELHGFTPRFLPGLWTTLEKKRRGLRREACDISSELRRGHLEF